LLLVATIATGVIYVAYRVKQKVAEIKSPSALSAKKSKAEGSSGGAPDSDLASVMKDLGNVGGAASSGTQGVDAAGTPGDQAKSMADAALVSQALLHNLDKPPSAIPASELPAGTGAISNPTPNSYTWTSAGAKYLWEDDIVRVTFARGTSEYGQCPVIKREVAAAVSTAPSKATGNQEQDWKLQYERTEGGPEADLVVRTGDINNLGFGWPLGFDPFSGQSTPPHSFPWKIRPGSAAGTDRIMLGSSFGSGNTGYDGYSRSASCSCPANWAPCENRLESMPSPIELQVGTLPSKINEILVQMFVDDFQAAQFHSHFQVSLNGTRIPSFEYAINSLDQTGPIGKLVTFKLLPEYWPLLKSGAVKLLIDDPTTHIGDGYAVDFARILINPHKSKYQVSLTARVVDANQHTPIAGATVTAALGSASTDSAGKCQLSGLPAGLVVATAAAPGYDENSVPVDLVAGQNGHAEIPLQRHREDTAALEKELAQTGQATIYGIHFDTDSAKLRPDSMPALNAVLGLINNHPNSRWTIAGHTDNQGDAGHNQTLSDNRSASVIAWLAGHGIDQSRLVPRGFGATRPVADNTTANGRALNRRVEVALAK
jgi:outer membrane protein OmpA-like peptidoglycan-associated protein